MPLIHPSHVVSFSSEDPNHPASNLLNRETFRKWKCKDSGEKEAYVLLKFDKSVSFSCIDIGNDGSALVEISVGRSGGEDTQYEVLLSSTAFMSPLDSREGKNLNGVRSFSANSLSKPIAAQKWDLVKVLVSQPFNRHVQFGLTFIKFTAVPDPNEPQKIGIFGFRAPIGGADSDEDDVKPGSLFNSKKLKSPIGNFAAAASSTNASIRETSSKLLNASKSSTEDKTKELLKKPKLDLPSPVLSTPKIDHRVKHAKGSSDKTDHISFTKKKQLPDQPIKSVIGASVQKQSPSSSNYNTAKASKKRALSPDLNFNGSGGQPSSSTKQTTTKKQKTDRKTKPFNKLFEGVVFTISGYENPYRGEIRDKGVQMGAHYKTDWDRTCTHLICAFVNTPKFRQVRTSGNGEIVKKDWIERSFADRCRYPWRRHSLDKNDKGNESEDEIHADDIDDEDGFVEMEDDQHENDDDHEVGENSKRKRVLVMDSSSDESDKSDASKKAYNADTDIDEDKTPDLSPSIMDSGDIEDAAQPLFQGSDFYICLTNHSKANSQEEISRLENIITKRKGRIHKTVVQEIEYYVCPSFEWNEDFSDALSDNPNLTFVHENWILECDKLDRMVDKGPFILLPR